MVCSSGGRTKGLSSSEITACMAYQMFSVHKTVPRGTKWGHKDRFDVLIGGFGEGSKYRAP